MKKKPAFVPGGAWKAAQYLLETYESERPLSKRWAKDLKRLIDAPELEWTWQLLDQALEPGEWVYFLGLLTPIYDELNLRSVLKKAATLRKDIASLAGELSGKLRDYSDLTESNLITRPDGLGSPEDVAGDAFSNLPTHQWLWRVLQPQGGVYCFGGISEVNGGQVTTDYNSPQDSRYRNATFGLGDFAPAVAPCPFIADFFVIVSLGDGSGKHLRGVSF